MPLSDKQKEIIDYKGNLIVSASAGTGKTHTMVAKIESELENNHSHRVIAAITFTIKAAKEIRERMKVDTSECFIGTNNSFVIEEVIKPFARDVYSEISNTGMNTDYSIKLKSFDECLKYLKDEKIICSYKDNRENFVFELALKIVKKSKACQRFLQAKYFKIFVDEYQDCDKTMHEFFMYLCNDLHIEFFIVGDDKQSIYIWRGAYPEAFRSIMKMKNFHNILMRENFRSCIQIQNYSNLLNSDTRDMYKEIDDISNIVFVSSDLEGWSRDVLKYINLEDECALLRFSNNNAEIGAKKLSESGVEFTFIPKTPISDISTEAAWLYTAIVQYCILSRYSIYDFIDDIPEETIDDGKFMSYLKKELNLIETKIKEEDETIIHVRSIAEYLNYSVSDDHIKKMIETINNEEYHPAFKIDELSHVSLTVHSSKGLEYDQVILVANDYALEKQESIFMHYVAATRARNKLIIVKICDEYEWAADSYCEKLQKIISSKGLSLNDIMTII